MPYTIRERKLGLRAVCRYEQLAMRALEAAVPLGVAGHQPGRERLLAVRTHDLVRGVRCGEVRHAVHGTCCHYGRKKR
jgi:hypothetical protein